VSVEHQRAAAVQEERNQAHYAVHFANRALVQRDWIDARYVTARQALDDLMLVLSKAKWLQGRSVGNYLGFEDHVGSAEELEAASSHYREVAERAKAIQSYLDNSMGDLAPWPLASSTSSDGTEILFYDGVPIVPTICPTVLLKGSNYDMGRQYATQVLDIYGPFIFRWHAERVFSAENLEEIARWEAELEREMPEVLDFARGWAEAATEWGLPMDYRHALAIWTGVKPPVEGSRPMGTSEKADESIVLATYMGGGDTSKKPRAGEKPSMCSGACAWGDATPDGKLVIGATTDHDCTFQATIIAFPDKGNSFVYTPFSANGSIPVLGHFYMAGHPGMNNKGVAYVHHAGATCGEPEEEWGYGVRRGPATFHLLQFGNSAREVRDVMFTYSVGDSGEPLGNVIGMWADSSYGISVEGRPGAPDPAQAIFREATYDREGNAYNVLYANNNAISPQSAHMHGAPKSGEGYKWEVETGWYTTDPKVIQSGSPGDSMRRRMTKDSAARNRYQHRTLLAGYGQIDLDYMTMKYRQVGEVPPGPFDEVAARYHAGEEWNVSTCHRANAFVVVAKPETGDSGIYRACIGPANRAANCRDPGHGYYYFDETAAFWEITLAGTPEAVVGLARSEAERQIAKADEALGGLSPANFAGHAKLSGYSEEAHNSINAGLQDQRSGLTLSGDARWAKLAKALRQFTRAQVRAEQIADAINAPASRPEMLREFEAA
jgi:hypothetical protein